MSGWGRGWGLEGLSGSSVCDVEASQPRISHLLLGEQNSTSCHANVGVHGYITHTRTHLTFVQALDGNGGC